MCKHDHLKHFRTITGEPRRLAMRAHLTTHYGVKFGQSHEDMTREHREALEDMARAVSWRKGVASRLTLAAAFYVYLSRDLKQTRDAAATVKTAQRTSFLFGSRGRA